MAAITYSNDGTNIFLAAEVAATGDQVVLKGLVSDLDIWTEAYSPVDGSAGNVKASTNDPDTMFFYGNFGTDVVIIKHAIAAGTNTDVSPASVGAREINSLDGNPTPLYDGSIELICHIDTAADIVYSDDTGVTWSTLTGSSALTSANDIEVIWRGTYYPHAYIVAGFVFVGPAIYLSPNAGANQIDVIDTITTTNICSIEYSGT